MGECPKCGHKDAYGDQCENCGATLSPNDLINPKSKLSGSKPVLKETKHWYLPLGNYEKFLTKWVLEGKKGIWKPNVYGQVKSWLDQGLESRAISRDLDWGIPIPRDDAKGKVMYVWFDAPIGYISSTKEWAERENKNWEDYWKKPDTKLIHFIGKDNIVFHCIIFPSILKAHGEFILPEDGHHVFFLKNEHLIDIEWKQAYEKLIFLFAKLHYGAQIRLFPKSRFCRGWPILASSSHILHSTIIRACIPGLILSEDPPEVLDFVSFFGSTFEAFATKLGLP